ncbi:MAG: hypothetical protein J3R72DRAFT_435617 [Linnemannia gamsii]|nr:MAG: hypothetical protein J3R72DRAFT_435617 [Linnemannia gamsii]
MHPPTSTTQLTGLEQPSPLDIPELLDRIFSYVDPYTIGNCVLMVSRDWHAAGRRYLQQAEHVWSDWLEDEGLDRLLEMLPWMTRLRWLSESGGGVAARDNRKRQWALLLTGLERATHGLQLAGRRNDLEEIQVYMDLLSLLPLSLVDSLATSQQGLAIGQGARLREFELCGQVY